MNIKFKGGSGLLLGKDNPYRYIFSVWINPNKVASPIISNQILSEENSITIPRTFNSIEYLKEGLNSVYIQYTGNYEDCEAYLDWIEFLYPRDFSAVKNQLFF